VDAVKRCAFCGSTRATLRRDPGYSAPLCLNRGACVKRAQARLVRREAHVNELVREAERERDRS